MIFVRMNCPNCKEEMAHILNEGVPVFDRGGRPLVICDNCKALYAIDKMSCSVEVLSAGELQKPNFDNLELPDFPEMPEN